jgi:3-hydroxyacyl-CoA dehydrogenase/enoyl-CoA hydratase/3-hydroxybutyryl-CoA epimerase
MSTAASWTLDFDPAGIAWLTCDVPNASTNVLSAQVLTDLAARLEEIRQRAATGVIVRSGKPNGFIAGADIKEFQGILNPDQGYALVRAGQAIISQIEHLPCPSVALLHGFVLGGGLELALACTYRIGADDASLSLGLPEVLLGIHPGFGGTARSVRTIGVRAALDLMLRGRALRGPQALKVGLLDALAPQPELAGRARQFIERRPPRRAAPLPDRLLNLRAVRPMLAQRMTATVRRNAPREHYPAPYAIVDLWRQHGGKGEASIEAEARSISRLMCTPTSRNLVRVFLLQDRLKSLGNESSADFKHLHVIGAGIMGGDIAAWAALRGMTVTLQDRSAELVRPALERAKTLFDKRLKVPSDAAQAGARLTMDVAGEGVARADVVLEAIFEDIEAKRALYASLEPKMKPTAILATNTSSIRIETLCQTLADPTRLVGIHFFNPVAQLPLVEIVHGTQTRPEIAADALRFARSLDKLPLPCRSAPGFVVNRVLTPYVNEAFFALEEGIPREVIDRAAVRFGMPVGPVELTDVVGLDVSLNVGRVLADAFKRPLPAVLTRLVEQKKLGRKTGEGFYRWQDGKAQRSPVEDAAIPPDLQDRLILPMLNEAVACWREGTVADTDLLDAGLIFATGFAPFRGGPLQYARDRGVSDIIRTLGELADRYGERFRPDRGWETILAGSASSVTH